MRNHSVLLLALVAILYLRCCDASPTSFIVGRIIPNPQLSGSDDLLPIRIVLDNKPLTWVRIDKSFIIHNITEGSHHLSFESIAWQFPTFRIDVDSGGLLEVRPVKYDTEWEALKQLSPLPFPLEVAPFKQQAYFQTHEGFNLIGLLSNPMVLLMGFSMLMMFGLPKMMASMDPEMAEEFRKSQAQAHSIMQRGSTAPSINLSEKLASLSSSGNDASSSNPSGSRKRK